MKNPLLLALLLLFLSCTQTKKKASEGFSPKQKQIVRWYKNIGTVSIEQPDSLGYYADQMERLAISEPKLFKAMATFVRGTYYLNSSSYNLSEKYYQQCAQMISDARYDTIQAKAYIGLGNGYKNTGEYPKAFDYLYRSLKIYEKHGIKYGIASAYGCMAQIYLQKNDLTSAEEHLKKSIDILGPDKYNRFYLISLHTLANVYGMEGNYKSALALDKHGIEIADKIHSQRNKSTFLDNKANCFMYSNQLDSAAYYFNECLKIDLAVGEKKQIADTYSNLGKLAMLKKEYPKAESYLKQSMDICREIRQKPNLISAYTHLVDLYHEQKKFEKALAAQLEKEKITNELISEKKEAALAEFKVLYETQKKEQQLAENQVLLLKKEAEAKQKNYLLVAAVFLTVFIALVSFLIYRQQKTTNRQQQQEFQLRSAIAQIEAQNQLQQQRLSISRDLHDNIGAQLTFIISSVDNLKYAFNIENPKLESKLSKISNFTKATIGELRDTIWAMNYTEISIEELQSRILNFIEKAKDAQDAVDFKFEIQEGLHQIKLSAVVGMNCYRTIQESIHNAIKYARASEVLVVVEKTEGQLRFIVRDNGQGFDLQKVEAGNGLHNIQKRIDDIGGTLQVNSKIGQGTSVIIDIPLT
ncbi:tetratricopeptide repeat protein [Flavobacterium sp. CYK-4]|uniref:tetratricopeptide repeat-containing sensor histidine kinase n=1 Tax=Flavobacterium lotistagni TaxID=2709660 RepID=UPI00140DBE17|nr:sensor histidine kinase [Flavobacterium lotistagni]NHM05660.1 tetratricopeptide repeat protein [Flavobacterium lotistagni]